MRKAGLALALVASAQLTLLSTPAFADDAAAAASESSTGDINGAKWATKQNDSEQASHKRRDGWIVLGIGGALTVGGIVLDIVGTTQGTVAGAGGNGDNGTTSESRTNFYWGGTALIVAGVLTGIWGGSMIVNADKKNVVEPSTPVQRQEDDASRDNVTKTVAASIARTPVFTVPLVGTTF